MYADITARFGPWPVEGRPNTARMAHAVRILTEYILPERNPSIALIWSSEPDKSQHDAGVGSELSNAAVGEADAQFGNILRWLSGTGRAGETNVMVVSDHGYSTIGEVVNVQALAREAGFPPGGEPGGVVVAQQRRRRLVLLQPLGPGYRGTSGTVADGPTLVRECDRRSMVMFFFSSKRWIMFFPP